MRILVVDDEFVSREKLMALMSNYGEVDAAPDGRTALQMITDAYRAYDPYELVTMDLNMPDISGHVAVQEMRNWERDNPQFANGFAAHVLIITATREIQEVMESFEDGAESYIVKPVNPENVADAVATIDFSRTYERPEHTPQAASQTSALDTGEIGSDVQPPSPRTAIPSDAATEYIAEYVDSTIEKLDTLEADALELETADDVLNVTNAIMRTLHSLKGEAGMIGLSEVSDILHRTESAVKANEANPACADFVLRIKDWMQLLVRYLEDPQAAEIFEAEQAPITGQAPAQTSANEPPAPGADIVLSHADQINYNGLVEDFLDDYIQSTTRRRKQLDASIEQLQASGDGTDLVTIFIGVLNGLKGEAAMIGLSDVSKGLHEVEVVFKDHATAPKPCTAMLKRCSAWIGEMIEHVRDMQKTRSR